MGENALARLLHGINYFVCAPHRLGLMEIGAVVVHDVSLELLRLVDAQALLLLDADARAVGMHLACKVL